MAEIQLKKFDITQIKDDKVVVLIGKRETGKSFLCKDYPISSFRYTYRTSYIGYRSRQLFLWLDRS